VHRLLPVSQQLPAYRGGTLRRDLLAGLSPVAGLYALLLPTVAYTLFGSSRQLIVGPEGSIAALVATALVPLAADDPERYGSLAALLALLVGACFLVAGVIRLGWVADYLSHRPVLRRPPRRRRHRVDRDGRGRPGRRHHPGLPHRGQRLAHRGDYCCLRNHQGRAPTPEAGAGLRRSAVDGPT
jgi:YD repeat-containing protein